MSETTTPFRVDIPQSALDDLQQRLALTRWPSPETGGGWAQGAPLAQVRALVAHWQTRYDWRRCEALLNSWPQFRTTIDGVAIHFAHIRAAAAAGRPAGAPPPPTLLLTHGWPGSVLEFRHVAGALADPAAHGGRGAHALDLVIPSLPGFGFSGAPAGAGWGPPRVARAWAELMRRLGCARWVAQGGDWGADVTAELGRLAPPGLVGVHMNSQFFDVGRELRGGPPTSAGERRARAAQDAWEAEENGYQRLQRTRPQTLAYALADSPAGQAAWIYEKLWGWSHHEGDVEAVFSKDEMLDDIMLYWLGNTAGSAARIYWEKIDTTALEIKVPVGVSLFLGDQSYGPREWAERYYTDLRHWNELERGGHFAAWEQPAAFVKEIRDFIFGGERPLV